MHTQRCYILLLISFFLGNIVPFYAQTTQKKYGKVKVDVRVLQESSDKAQACLISGQDTITVTYSNSSIFYWEKVPVGPVVCKAWSDGFIPSVDTLIVKPDQLTEKTIWVENWIIELQPIIIQGNIPAVVYKGDTIRFNPLGVTILEDDVAKDILEQMPGVKVTEQSVEINGKTVKKTYVDGRKIFGEDPMSALNHLPASDVLRIYAYDEHAHKEQAEVYKKGEKQRVLNIETKSKLINSTQADVFISAGKNNTEKDIPDGENFRYGAGGIFNFFSEEFLFSTNLLHNNMNIDGNRTQNYQSLKEPPRNYSENTYSGFSMSKHWKDKNDPLLYKKLETSYHYSKKLTKQDSENRTEYFPTSAFQNRNYTEILEGLQKNRQHQMSLSFETEDKRWGYIRIRHALSKDDSDAQNNRWLSDNIDGNNLYEGRFRNNQKGNGINLTENLQWSKYFGMWQMHLSLGYTHQKQDTKEYRRDSVFSAGLPNLSSRDIDLELKNNVWNGAYSLRKSLSKENTNYIGIEYSVVTSNKSDDQAGWDNSLEDHPVIDISNTYLNKSRNTTHQTSINSESAFGKFHLLAKIGWQHDIVEIHEQNVNFRQDKQYDSFISALNLSFNKAITQNQLAFGYSLSSRLPSTIQMFSRINNANPYFLTTGNAGLSPTKIHSLKIDGNLHFNNLGNTLSSELTVNIIQNGISTKTNYFQTDTYLEQWDYTARAGSSLISYENLNGAWDIDWLTMWDVPVISFKSNFSLIAGFNHSQTPYFYTSTLDKEKSNNARIRYSLSYNRIRNVRARISGLSSFNTAKNDISGIQHNSFLQTADLTLNIRPIMKHFFVNLYYSFGFQNYEGITRHINRTHVLNTYIGCKLFERRAELSFTAYDILNQNNPDRVSTKENYISRRQSVNYGRYFALTFSWNFRKIKSNRFDISRGISNVSY